MVAHGWLQINNFAQYCCDLDGGHSVINPQLVWSEDTDFTLLQWLWKMLKASLYQVPDFYSLSTLTRLPTLDPVRCMKQAAWTYLNN